MLEKRRDHYLIKTIRNCANLFKFFTLYNFLIIKRFFYLIIAIHDNF